MNRSPKGINTICTHIGEVKDDQFKGAISQIRLNKSLNNYSGATSSVVNKA